MLTSIPRICREGFAGGIVSAAVDGMVVAEAILGALFEDSARRLDSTESMKVFGTFY
jgi:hypothetical protein